MEGTWLGKGTDKVKRPVSIFLFYIERKGLMSWAGRYDQNGPSKTQFRKYQRGLTSTFVGYGGWKKITYRFSGKSQ
jgi:hypothetical protein